MFSIFIDSQLCSQNLLLFSPNSVPTTPSSALTYQHGPVMRAKALSHLSGSLDMQYFSATFAILRARCNPRSQRCFLQEKNEIELLKYLHNISLYTIRRNFFFFQFASPWLCDVLLQEDAHSVQGLLIKTNAIY